MTTLEGQAFRCVSSSQDSERFDQWVTTFRTVDGQVSVNVISTGDNPGYVIGDRYRLDVLPVALLGE